MEPPVPTTIYYDGACPVCTREMALYRGAAGAEALRFVDVTREPPPPGVTRAEALARLHVRGADGAVVSGAAAFAALWCSLPRWRLLGRVAGHPTILPLLDAGYSAFLRLRRLWRRE